MSFLDKTGLARLWANILALVETSTNTRVPNSRTINNKSLSNDITLRASDVEADPAGSADSALKAAKQYTDKKGHMITAGASDDDIVNLSGTAGLNGVTYTASHANSGVTAGTYQKVTVDAKGHVTGGANPTTLSGYGITDALKSNTKYAASSSVGGAATSANKMNITRASKSILTIAAETPVDTEVIYFAGSDGVNCDFPKTYCIANIKKGNNHRTLIDCYHLNTGDHYINGCMDTRNTATYPWTGWVLQPNKASMDEISSTLKTYTTNAVSAHNADTSAHSDIRDLIEAIAVPTKVSELENDSGFVKNGDNFRSGESINSSRVLLTPGEILVAGEDGEGVYITAGDWGSGYVDGKPVLMLYGSAGDEAARITNIDTPVFDYDAANKIYVDAKETTLKQYIDNLVGDVETLLKAL